MSVRPSKIVAGHEADKTNEWLQALGHAVAKNVSQKLIRGTGHFEGTVPHCHFLIKSALLKMAVKLLFE